MSETCRVLYQVDFRNSASRWISLKEYNTMHGPLNVKFTIGRPTVSSDFGSYLYDLATKHSEPSRSCEMSV